MSEEKIIKAYKAFKKDMTCNGFQYEVGKEYDMDGKIECCRRGFHACELPSDVFKYYEIYGSRFAEVELSGITDSNEGFDSKICASHIKIVKELTLSEMVEASIILLKNKITCHNLTRYPGKKCHQIFSSSDNKRLTSQRRYSTIISFGNRPVIVSNGDESTIVTTGEQADITTAIGNYVTVLSSGDKSSIRLSGLFPIVVSTGNCSRIYSSAEYSSIASEGEKADIVCACHYVSFVKAKVGSRITIVLNDAIDRHIPHVTEIVDGERIKGDTWYRIYKNGEFEEI